MFWICEQSDQYVEIDPVIRHRAMENSLWLEMWLSLNNALNNSFCVCVCESIYLYSESSNGGWVERWVLLLLLVNQSIMGNETIGLPRFTPSQACWVGPYHRAQHVWKWFNIKTFYIYQCSWNCVNLPEGVTMGAAISCGFASKVRAKVHWLRTEPFEL